MAIIKCPECGHQVSDKAPVCPNCGVEIAGKTIRCPQCGEIYFKEEPACPNCHHTTVVEQSTPVHAVEPSASTTPQEPLRPLTEEETSPKTETTSSNRRTIFIVSFVIALIICATCIYFYSNAKGNKEQEAYEYAMKSQDPLVLQSFLDTYTDASEAHRDSIQAHLTALNQIDKDWTNAVVSNSKMAIEDYLERHPDTPHKEEALHKLDSIDWANAQQANTKDAFVSYLEDHPNGEHVDDAKDGIKNINAKTVQPEEKLMISSIFRQFFQSINSKDEDGLTNTVNSVLTSFLGKSDATKNDVVTFMHKIYKDDIANMTWRLPGDYKIDKKEIGDNEYEYTVSFSAVQEVEKTDNSTSNTKFRIKAKVDPDGKITEFNMLKILE
ncbi:hypothetical protein HMPREF0663_12116 [Hoylesella oralis ATCC 33269]|uniref:Putative zinc-ribbon domain-containing protein n=1 Tax=Hoylesella oralis ATCC 33269 TaxID=873533 RepID=E7RS48_9BACT|nr:zinc ribbon domain-containing protein [Hoylesella oralis]EFZ36049.1 hypothetical protein HMPREF0663_12116 [Hoylesella oralis ATCC 33269]EPH19116.1 hypothetical protein HMPREF1475_00364 [Hoylesella oralis HGA0225]SHF60794.1 zinc-ribbon domain-containing protein [Hoylesella oralis]